MKYLYHSSLLLMFSFFGVNAFGQLVVTTGQTAQQLAEVIAGPGVVVSNATFTGSVDAFGAFGTGANPTGLNMTSGVLISTGNAVDAAGDEPGIDASTGHGLPGNAWLESQSGVNSNDAAILEFDFVPNADYAQFKFIFCSEEYPDFVCSNFNDLFAITIEGVSTVYPLTNIALIPGTATPVAINSVNDQGCGDPTYYIDNSGSAYIEYGGLTQPLIAETPVICGETYHLAFMIADGFDDIFDSGCFIEENSLTTGSVVVETATAAADSTAYEGCNDATVTLTLNGPPIAQDFPVPIWISDATADMGIDYANIPQLNLTDSTILIPAGQNTVQFVIDPVNDNITEGPEYIEFIVITSTCGLTDTFRIYIDDLDPITTQTSNDTTICMGNAMVWCEATGGGGLYTYTWDNGFGMEDTIYPGPVQTTVYHVSVEDNCNSTPAVDSVTVTVDDGPTPFAGNDVSVCIGGSVLLNATSDAPGSTFGWTPGTDLSDSTIYNPMCTPQQDMEYIVRVTRPDGCYNDDTVLVTLTSPPTAVFDLPPVGCAGEPLITEYTGNASASAQYNWNFDGGVVTNGTGGGPIAVYWPSPGTYDVELIVSWNGCLSPTGSDQIEILGPPAVSAGSDISFCSGDSGSIGSAPIAGLTYSWSPTSGVTDPLASLTSVSLTNLTHDIEIHELVLTAIDQGCKNDDTVEVTVFPIPTAEFAIPDGMCFNVNSFDLLATGYFGPNATFNWDFGPVGYPASSTDRQPEGVIFNEPGPQNVTLTITDNSCVSEPFVGTIDVYEMPVAEFSYAPSDGCEPLLVQFEDQSYNGNSTLYYTWNFGNGTSSTQSDPSAVYELGSYSVSLSVVTGQGCADQVTQSGIIEAFEKPDALFSMNSQRLTILDPKVVVTNLADSIVSSEFTFHPFNHVVDAMQTEFEYPDTGTFAITQIVTTANGCMDTITGSLKVDPFYTLYIPDAFTPDDNQVNETWLPQGQSIKSFEMTIYNRWDQELFFSASLEQGWDGTFKGMQVPQGVYIYSIETMDLLGEPHIYRGTFKLLR